VLESSSFVLKQYLSEFVCIGYNGSELCLNWQEVSLNEVLAIMSWPQIMTTMFCLMIHSAEVERDYLELFSKPIHPDQQRVFCLPGC
jgi:hypothetical protein